MTSPTTHPVAEVLAALRGVSPGDKVLSVYLQTPRQTAAGRPYATVCREGCLALRAGLDSRDTDAFDVVSARVERYLAEEYAAGSAGVTIFAARAAGYFFTVALPEAPDDEIAWESKARLEPLEEQQDEFGRTAIVLVDQRRARLFTVFLGEIESREEVRDDVPGRSNASGWYSLAQTRIARHHEQLVLRHLHRTTTALLKLFEEQPFARLLVAGPEETRTLFRHQLPRPLAALLAEDLTVDVTAAEPAVLHAGLAAAERSARGAELEAVAALVEADASPAVALGAEATLRAVNDGRVHRLLLATAPALSGSVCEGCGRLALAGGSWPFCGAALKPAADLRAILVERSRRQGAGVYASTVKRRHSWHRLRDWVRGPATEIEQRVVVRANSVLACQ